MTEAGVRAQRKSQTRDALCRAAVEIVAAEGLDGLTADRIAAEAGVSRRTLFNYFARVEDVVTATIEDLTSETIREVIERPAGEPLRESLCAVLESLVEGPAFEQVRVLERGAGQSAATRRFLLEFGDRQARAFEEGLRQRIGPDADPVYVVSLAAAAAAVLGRVSRLVVEATDDEAQAAARHAEHVRRAFGLLFDGFDESHAVTGHAAAGPTDPTEEV
jgi:AcrR family transcriptional regulator